MADEYWLVLSRSVPAVQVKCPCRLLGGWARLKLIRIWSSRRRGRSDRYAATVGRGQGNGVKCEEQGVPCMRMQPGGGGLGRQPTNDRQQTEEAAADRRNNVCGRVGSKGEQCAANGRGASEEAS